MADSELPTSQSPWLDVLKTPSGVATAVVAALAGLIEAIDRAVGLLGKSWWVTAAAGLTIGISAIIYLRAAYRRRKLGYRVEVSAFVGARPLTEEDVARRRFHGREAQIDEIIGRLDRPGTRLLILFGETGCGKSSIVRAGVMPRLAAADARPVYLRFFDQPVRELREALRGVCPVAGPAAESVDLMAELLGARERAGKTLIVFIDQFEEFFVNPVGGADHKAVLDLVWQIIGRDANVDAKLVVCLRSDFLDQMEVLQEPGQVENIFDSPRVRLEPFDVRTAAEVIRRALQQPDGTGGWSDALIARVLDDLVVERVVHGETRQIVLPAELQIVCQMVQAQNISDVREYPGKRQLILDYVDNAIATAPGGMAQTKQLLLALIAPNGLTKARPQTLPALVERLQFRDDKRLRRLLDFLDQDRHLVHCMVSEDQPGTPAYELAHDYLAGVIQTIAGAERTAKSRSQAILEGMRINRILEPRFRLGIGSCYHLYRYPPDRMAPEDRQLLRRSLRSFGLRVCAPIGLSIAVAGLLRFGTVHFDVVDNEVVIKRGLPFAPPLLGSAEPMVTTGIMIDSQLLKHSEGEEVMKALRQRPWLPSGLALLRPAWAPDHVLNQQIADRGRKYFTARSGNLAVREYADEHVITMLQASGAAGDEVAGPLWEGLRDGFLNFAGTCAGQSSPFSQDCDLAISTLETAAANLRRLSPEHQKARKFFQDRLEQARPSTWAFEAAIHILGYLRAVEQRTVQTVKAHLRSPDLQVVGAAAAGLNFMPIQDDRRGNAVETIRDLLSEPERLKLAKQLTTAVVGAEAVKGAKGRERIMLIDVLQSLGLPNPEFVSFLQDELKSNDLVDRKRALDALCRLKVEDESLILALVPMLERGRDRLVERSKASISGSLVLDDEMGFGGYDRDLHEAAIAVAVLANHAQEDPRLRGALRELIVAYLTHVEIGLRTSYNIGRMAKAARRMQLPLSQVIEHLPEPKKLQSGEYDEVLQSIFESALEDDLASKPDQSANARIRDVLPKARRGGNGCQWVGLALEYQVAIEPALLTEMLHDPECSTSYLPGTYARRHLVRANESLEKAGQRLLSLLRSPEADAHTTVRLAVGVAIETAARDNAYAGPQGIKAVRELEKLLLQERGRAESPFSHRLTLTKILWTIDQVLYHATTSLKVPAG